MVDDALSFADDSSESSRTFESRPWKLLVVDDDQAVHSVTRLALDDIEVCGRGVELLHAHSGAEALECFRQHPDIAMCLLDVIMESERAGLDLAQAVREDLGNTRTRIVLRTGQPADVPERDVIRRYDIQGYTQKSELTATRLYTTTYTMISAYRDLCALARSRDALKAMFDAMAKLADLPSLKSYAQALLDQMCALVDLEAVIYVGWDWQGEGLPKVLATSGVPSAEAVADLIRESVENSRQPVMKVSNGELLMIVPVGNGDVCLGMVARCGHELDETELELVSLFCSGLSAAASKNFSGSFE